MGEFLARLGRPAAFLLLGALLVVSASCAVREPPMPSVDIPAFEPLPEVRFVPGEVEGTVRTATPEDTANLKKREQLRQLREETLIRIVDRNDALDGKAPSCFEAGGEALSGTDVVFFVPFTDGSEGIYVATVPMNVCGNGIVEEGESCDDGNANEDDLCYSTCRWRIPAVSEWGLMILALMVVLAGTIVLRRQRAGAA